MPGASPACTKCGSPSCILLPSNGPRCESCFVSQTQRAYKIALGRSHYRPRTSAPLALLVSGGASSTALALLHAEHLRRIPSHSGLPAVHQVLLVHVVDVEHEDNGASEQSDTKRAATEGERSVREIGKRCGFDVVIVRDRSLRRLRGSSSAGDVDLGRRRAAAIRRIGMQAAVEAGAENVMVGTCADRAAVDILERVVAGVGEAVANAAAEVEDVDMNGVGRLRVLKPLLHVPIRQVVLFSRFSAPELFLVSRERPTVTREEGIRGTLEKFVGVVQAENGACVHNVVRTAGKLVGGRSSEAMTQMRCDGCGDVSSRPVCTENGSGGISNGHGNSEALLCFACERVVGK